MNDKILVIIVTFNAMQWIKKCIQSVKISSIPLDLFIVDNNSSDTTSSYIKEKYPFVKFIQNRINLGFGAANNIGLQYAIDNNYDYVYLLNQDAWIKPDTISILINAHKIHPEYGILSPKQTQANENVLDKNFSLIFPEQNQQSSIFPVDHVMAAHWLISRKCLMEVGGFSPTFHHYGEDDNYCDRARIKGFNIGIVPKAVAIHDRGDRVLTSHQKLYASYVRTIVYLSGFSKSSVFALYGFVCDCVKYLFKEKSFSFIKYFRALIADFYSIKSNKKKSLNRTAFLRESKVAKESHSFIKRL